MDTVFYWGKGLHDANIINCKEITFDYNVEEKNPIRNCLELVIDSRHALFDTTIKGIRLYNYKILSDLKNPLNLWWKEDKLETKNNKFILTIFGHNDEIFIIRFDKGETIR